MRVAGAGSAPASRHKLGHRCFPAQVVVLLGEGGRRHGIRFCVRGPGRRRLLSAHRVAGLQRPGILQRTGHLQRPVRCGMSSIFPTYSCPASRIRIYEFREPSPTMKVQRVSPPFPISTRLFKEAPLSQTQITVVNMREADKIDRPTPWMSSEDFSLRKKGRPRISGRWKCRIRQGVAAASQRRGPQRIWHRGRRTGFERVAAPASFNSSLGLCGGQAPLFHLLRRGTRLPAPAKPQKVSECIRGLLRPRTCEAGSIG